MKLVIGIIGAPLAGKETCANVLEQLLIEDGYSVSRHTFSDILRDTLDLWDLPHARDNLQKMAIVMNAEMGFGDGVLSHAMRHATHGRQRRRDDPRRRALARRRKDDPQLERRWDQNHPGIYFGGHKTRYARLIARNRAGEAATTWEDFSRQEQAQTEVDIPHIGSRAEIILENNDDDMERFKHDINRVYESLFDQGSR